MNNMCSGYGAELEAGRLSPLSGVEASPDDFGLVTLFQA